MHNGATLDVLSIVERLEGGGVPHDQAKVQAAVLVDVIRGECKCMDARYLARDDLANELLPLKSGIQMVDAKVDRLAVEARAMSDRLAVEARATSDRLAAEAKAATERLEMRMDKTAADLKSEIIKWTLSVWFLQFGLFTALLFKVTT